jgi:hypothetical protein
MIIHCFPHGKRCIYWALIESHWEEPERKERRIMEKKTLSLQGWKQWTLITLLIAATLAPFESATVALAEGTASVIATLDSNKLLVATAAAEPNNCFELLSDLAGFDMSPPTLGKERYIQFFLVSNTTLRPNTITPPGTLPTYAPGYNAVEYIDGRLDWMRGSRTALESLSGQGLQYWNTERWGPLLNRSQNPFDPLQANNVTLSIPIANTDPPPEVTVGSGLLGTGKFVPRCEGGFMYGFTTNTIQAPTMYVVTFRKAESAPPSR